MYGFRTTENLKNFGTANILTWFSVRFLFSLWPWIAFWLKSFESFSLLTICKHACNLCRDCFGDLVNFLILTFTHLLANSPQDFVRCAFTCLNMLKSLELHFQHTFFRDQSLRFAATESALNGLKMEANSSLSAESDALRIVHEVRYERSNDRSQVDKLKLSGNFTKLLIWFENFVFNFKVKVSSRKFQSLANWQFSFISKIWIKIHFLRLKSLCGQCGVHIVDAWTTALYTKL